MLQNETILNLLDYYKSHHYKEYIISDIYDGSVWKTQINSDDIKNADIKIGITFCYDGLDVYSSGNNTGLC